MRGGAAGQTNKDSVQSFTYLGGAATETPDMSTETARRTRACWMTSYNRALEMTGRESVENIALEKTFIGGGAHPNEWRAVAKANRARKP